MLRIVHVACRLADVLGYYITRPLIPEDMDVVLAELPTAARERLHASADEMRARIEKRLHVYDRVDAETASDEDSTATEAAPEAAGPNQTEPIPAEPRSVVTGSRAAIALAVLIALAAALLFLRR